MAFSEPRINFIDGLRAVAVFSVVAYHVGIPGFSGGFIGVDIFFVISGYLIINHIVGDIKNKNFSLYNFYMKRFLRIFPPFLLVIAATIIGAQNILIFPNQWNSFQSEIIASVGMWINFLFLNKQGYFDASADNKLLLHMWSLAVEEQFYLFAPILLLAFSSLYARFRSRRLMEGLGALLFLASLAGCIAFTAQDRNPAFFMMPLRAWEFIAGGAIPLFLETIKRHRAGALLAWLGLLVTLGGIAGLATLGLYPSYLALLPVVGATCLMAGGLSDAQSWPVRLLATRPFRMVGLVSYSWYLWHWPVLTLERLGNFGNHTLLLDLRSAAISFGLAVLTYLLLERPIQRHRDLVLRSSPAIALAGSISLCVLVAFLGARNAATHALAAPSTFAGTFETGEQSWSLYDKENCTAKLTKGLSPDCLSSADDSFGFLIGDSHAENLYRPLIGQIGKNRLIGLAERTCPPIDDVEIFWFDHGALGGACHLMRELSLKQLSQIRSKPTFAILSARWNIYVPNRHPLKLDEFHTALTEGHDRITPAENQEHVFKTHFQAMLAKLENLGIRRILVLLPGPEFSVEIPICAAAAIQRDASPLLCSEPRKAVEARRAVAVSWITAVTAQHTSVRVIDPLDAVCDANLCNGTGSGGIWYVDSHHLSMAGANHLLDVFKHDIEWASQK
ncbi:acyltransferase family protein [Roseixanthobacter liquoris]|uniref:acyltransferase family protein n=1 Tax=Roseixanthobacter liquoris TaxID=3119921 RepID=UPI00372CC773